MFDNLTGRLETFVRNLRGQGKLSETNVKDTLREVRRILLEADVSLKAAKAFVRDVQEKSLGHEVLKSVTPGQQMVKIIHDELVSFLGGASEPIRFGKSPSPILVVGLNGAGKTTTSAKLAAHLRKRGRKPLLVAADTFRPAAIDQLETLGRQIDIPVFSGDRKNALKTVADSRDYARELSLDCLIIDSAGRMAVNDELMNQLQEMQDAIKPPETLLVVDGMTGQDAVRSANAFLERIELTGLVMTKLDGDSRGGAALSIRWVTGKPIKFIGVGEKTNDFEQFHPDRMAGRILGLGDVVSFVEKAQEAVDIESAQKMADKLAKQQFTFDDFREQLHQLKNMGPLESVLGMIPGMKSIKGLQVDENQFVVVESIIDSMTPAEREVPKIINGSRRRRIAQGCGRSVQDVNRLLNQFEQMQKMIKRFGKKGPKFPGGFPGMPGF
ncbi:MAG: signal recognition particle protein [Calditrichaeota bacterium]|jgi:signal recognition particle subunit SRP54|nr:signal recognition particle protein [Calditrichota bacterium]MBT7788951.1 signal recognition particle protein [Calditrichota bacterium]